MISVVSPEITLRIRGTADRSAVPFFLPSEIRCPGENGGVAVWQACVECGRLITPLKIDQRLRSGSRREE